METGIVFLSKYWPYVAVAGTSILLVAFFAAAEAAIVFSNKARLQQLAEEGNAKADRALRLAVERDRLLGTVIVAENLFIILSSTIGAVIALQLFRWTSIAIAVTTGTMLLLVVLFAKLVPKGVAAKNPDRLVLIVSSPMYVFMKLVSPLARAAGSVADLFAGPGSSKVLSTTAVTEEDIKAMINLGGEEGSLEEEEKELLHKVFEFGDTVASEAMRPRTEIVSVAKSATMQEVLDVVTEYGYSRYPVIEETVDTVIGILYVKDILIDLSSGNIKRDEGIQRFIRPAYFIPENKRVSELLSEMQREKFQIAIVIDEYGGTAGLVTTEDLVEEIVGSIQDELDTEEKEVEIVDEKNFVVAGQSGLDEVNDLLGAQLHSEDFNTIGGFVFGLFGRMPRVGEQLRYKDLKFEILQHEGKKIEKIKITKL